MVFDHHARTGMFPTSGGSVTYLEVAPVETVDSWQLYLVEVAHHLRRTVGADPGMLRALTQPPRIANWVSPPVGDVRLAEAFLVSMVEYGFSDEDAAAIYLTFFTRVLGVLCAEAAAAAPSATAPKMIDVTTYPTLARLRPRLSRSTDRSDFDAAVDDIVTSLEQNFR